MPIYTFRVIDGEGQFTTPPEIIEQLHSYRNRPNTIHSSDGRKATYVISPHAKPIDYNKYGVNGFYDKGLGRYWTNHAERDILCKQLGVTPVENPRNYWEQAEKTMRAQEKERDALESMSTRYQANLAKHGGDAGLASEETWNSEAILADKDPDVNALLSSPSKLTI